MNLKKYWRRFNVWIGIKKTKPEKEIVKLLKQATRVEEQQECDHKMLSALFPADIWYRCTNCNQIWIITQAMTINAKKLPELVKKFQTVGRIIPKNKKTMSLKEFKKIGGKRGKNANRNLPKN